MGDLLILAAIVKGFLFVVLASLLVCGMVQLIIGIVTRAKNKEKDPAKAKRAVGLIVGGIITILPVAMIPIWKGVVAVKTAVDNHGSLYYQLFHGEVDGLERLLKNGVCVEDAGLPKERPARDGECTMLGTVAEYSIGITDGTEKLALLIEYGADVNRTMCGYCEYGHPNGKHRELCSATPVLFACTVPNYEALKLLIDSGGDVNAVDYDGNSALDLVDKKLQNDRLDPEWRTIYEQMRELLVQSGAKSATRGKS